MNVCAEFVKEFNEKPKIQNYFMIFDFFKLYNYVSTNYTRGPIKKMKN